MRWDIRHPEKRFGDRFILGAGIRPAGLLHARRPQRSHARQVSQTGDNRTFPRRAERMLPWEDLLGFRRHGGLSGHAEMEGKTLFLKFNTGPSGHGSPAAAGEALALKRAGADGVKVFCVEGEGGLTPGGVLRRSIRPVAWHSTISTSWLIGMTLGLTITRSASPCVARRPSGSAVTAGACSAPSSAGNGPGHAGDPRHDLWGQSGSRAERGLVQDPQGPGLWQVRQSLHGAPHKQHGEFWETKRHSSSSMARSLRISAAPRRETPPSSRRSSKRISAVIEVLHRDQELVDYIADRLVALGDSVPEEIPGFKLQAPAPPLTTGERVGAVARKRRPIQGRAALRLPELSRRPVRQTGHFDCEPRRALPGGACGSTVRRAGIWSAAVHGRLCRSGRLDQHQRLRRAHFRRPKCWLRSISIISGSIRPVPIGRSADR